MIERTTTWNSIGKTVSECTSLEEVLKVSGLDFEVIKTPLYYSSDKKRVQGSMATMRKSDKKMYGIVSNNYQICQNADAFDFVNYIDEDIRFTKAGETFNGMSYLVGELPEKTILGDTFVPNIIIRNGFNGGFSIQAMITPVRIACMNQFKVALAKSINNVSIRHSSSMTIKLEDAKNVLSATTSYMSSLDKMANELAMIKFSDSQVENIINGYFPIHPEMTTRQVNSVMNRRFELIDAYNHEDNLNFKNRAWGLVNAMSDFMTHSSPARKTKDFDDKRFMYVTFSDNSMDRFIEFMMDRAA